VYHSPGREYGQHLFQQHLVNSISGVWGSGKKLMALYTGYFDDSGSECNEYLSCCGLVIDVERPEVLDAAWLEAINPLQQLHTADLVSGNGAFMEWKGRYEEKSLLLMKAAKTISALSFQTFSSVIAMEDYRAVDKELAFSEFLAYPFALCARFCDIQLRRWAKRNDIQDVIEIVFEQRTGSGEVVEVFTRDGIPIPSFKSKSLTPLQAADLLAWLQNGKLAKSDNYARVDGNGVIAEISATLHTHDLVSRTELLAICRRMKTIAGVVVPDRKDLSKPVAFHSSKKRNRKRFV
jgi:hypothetical protein